ncbi:MAG: FHA domain-containing protein [Acidobacteria bacterium]|nr:MAG: FHA domain-containing protein [Acidobacteriota bacterium]
MKELSPFPMKRSPREAAPVDEPLDPTRLADAPGGPEAADPSWAATLEVVSGDAHPRSVRLGSARVRLGRAPANDLVLKDDLVSRSHAEVRWEDGRYVVEDLGSSNGVRLDEKRTKKAPLVSGARLGLGKVAVTFTQPVPPLSEADRRALVERSDLLATMGDALKASVARSLVPRFVPRGGVVLRQGTPLESLLLVHRGRVKAVEVNEEGGERVTDRLGAGDTFGEGALVTGGTAPVTLVAESDACLVELPKSVLDELLRSDPEQGRAMEGSVRLKLRTAQHRAPAGAPRRADLDDLVTPTAVELLGEEKSFARAKEKLAGFAKDDGPVLVVGPQGAGKRTFSRHLHASSSRSGQPYVELSTTEPPAGGLAAAILGAEPAAGGKAQAGLLELLGDGTLAIAHAELLDAHLQALLASYLRLGRFHRLGGDAGVKSRTRIVLLATGDEAGVLGKLVPELKELVAKRTVTVPPLTLRLKDVPLLAEHYLKLHAAKAGKKPPALSREAVDRLVSYAWPGNVTELANVMQRAAIVASEERLIAADLIFVAPPEKEVHKLNLLHDDRFRQLLRRPSLMRTLIGVDVVFVLLVTAVTLWGGTRPPGHPLNEFATNPGMLVTWLVWFPLLPVSAVLLGRVWCGVCPIAGIGDLVARLKRYDLPVPKVLKRLDFWGLAASFVLVDYLEELFGVADRPWATAMFLVVIVYLAVAMTVLFERKAFCRHVCPLAGVLGAYSTMSVLEVRGNKKVCQTQCGEHSCFKGTDQVAGCPLSAYPASIATNAECMMCTNCVKSCDHRGVQLNLRPPLQELWANAQPTLAMSLFGVLLVGLMAKHQFPMLTLWQARQQSLGWSEGVAHTVLFVSFALLAVVPFLFSATLSAAASREKVSRNMALYGIAFVPLAFSGHLAHVLHEILGEGLYELLGYARGAFGSLFRGVPIASATPVAPFVAPAVVTFVKFLVVLGGVAGSLVALLMIARRVSREHVFARALPHALLVLLLFAGYLVIFTGSTDAPAPGVAGAGRPAAVASR